MIRIAVLAVTAALAATAHAQPTKTPPVWDGAKTLDCVFNDRLGSTEKVLFRVDLAKNTLCSSDGNKCMPVIVERKPGLLVVRIAPEDTSPRVFEILPDGKYTSRKPDSTVIEADGVCQKAGA